VETEGPESAPDWALQERSQRPVGRNKLAQFRHGDSAFAVGRPELRRLVPAYMLAEIVKLQGARGGVSVAEGYWIRGMWPILPPKSCDFSYD